MVKTQINYICEYPETWTLTKIKYLLSERNEKSITGEEMLLSVSQYYGVIPSSENKMQTMQASSLIGYKIVKKGDLVFNKLNPGLARFGCSDFDGITSPDFAVYIPNKKTNSRFMSYLLKSERYVTHIKSLGAGVGEGFARLYTPQLFSFSVALPKIDELTKITNFLDKKNAEIDEIRKTIEAQIEKLDQYRKSIIFEATTSGLNSQVQKKESGIEWIGMVPRHWKIIKNRYIFTKKKDIVGRNWENTQLLSLTKKGIIKKDINEGGGKQPDSFSTYQLVEDGDMVFCLFDLDVSAVFSGLSPLCGMISPAYKRYVCKNGFLNRYYKFYFDAVFSGRHYKLYSKNLRYTIDDDVFDSLLTLVPPLHEQEEIADYLENKCLEIEQIIDEKNDQLVKLDEYKKSLIFEYITGKKEVPHE